MKNQELGDGCGSEGPEGAGSVGCPPPPLSPPAEGRPAPSTGPPSAGPSWRGLGTPEETEVPHLQGTLGPTCDEEPGGRCGTWGVGGAQRTTVRGEGRSLAVCHCHTGTKGLSPWPRHCALAGLGLLVSNSSAPLGLPHENWLH